MKTEQNRLIAEQQTIMQFMGLKPCDRCSNCGLYMIDGIYVNPPKYDTDPSAIWEVVEKIESLGYEFIINFKVVQMTIDGTQYQIVGDTKLSAVYNAIIQFIEFYNERHEKE